MAVGLKMGFDVPHFRYVYADTDRKTGRYRQTDRHRQINRQTQTDRDRQAGRERRTESRAVHTYTEHDTRHMLYVTRGSLVFTNKLLIFREILNVEIISSMYSTKCVLHARACFACISVVCFACVCITGANVYRVLFV